MRLSLYIDRKIELEERCRMGMGDINMFLPIDIDLIA